MGKKSDSQASAEVMAGWTKGSFASAGITHRTYTRGTGPGVVVVHEIPGITPTVAKFANEVVDAGFTVVMPLLVGTAGPGPSGIYLGSSLLKVCIAKEFTTLALNQTSSDCLAARACQTVALPNRRRWSRRGRNVFQRRLRAWDDAR